MISVNLINRSFNLIDLGKPKNLKLLVKMLKSGFISTRQKMTNQETGHF